MDTALNVYDVELESNKVLRYIHTGEISQAECAHKAETGMDVTVVRVTFALYRIGLTFFTQGTMKSFKFRYLFF